MKVQKYRYLTLKMEDSTGAPLLEYRSGEGKLVTHGNWDFADPAVLAARLREFADLLEEK